MHKDSTGQTTNQVMIPLQQRFGKPCLCRATLSVWKKCVYLEKYEGFSSEQSASIPNGDLAVVATFVEQSPHKSVQKWSAELGVLHLTMFDQKRDLVMKPFWPVFVIELSNADVRLSQSMCFAVGIISASLVSWDSSLFR